MWGNWTSLHWGWECKMVQPLWKILWRFKKSKNSTTTWSCNLTPFYLSNRIEISIWKIYLFPYIHCSIIHNGQDMETMGVSVSRWMDKKLYIHTIKYYTVVCFCCFYYIFHDTQWLVWINLFRSFLSLKIFSFY